MTPYYADEAVTLHHGDCLDVLRTLPDASVDAVVTDPPYGLADHTPAVVAKALGAWLGGDREHVPDGRGFMGRDWDRFVPPPAVFDECLRVLKPGGFLLSFAGSRTVDLMTTSVRFAGFEIRDGMAWLYGSGFPKSLDVSKAIDKRGGNAHLASEIGAAIKAARESRGWTTGQADRHFCGGSTNWTWYEGRKGMCRPPTPTDFGRIAAEWPELAEVAEKVAEADREVVGRGEAGLTAGSIANFRGSQTFDLTAPATAAAHQWQGWGTALKPAFEPIVVGRKPLIGTVAANVLEHGTGALNIAACRTEAGDAPEGRLRHGGGSAVSGSMSGPLNPDIRPASPAGRWPTNVVLDESQAAELDKQTGDRPGNSNRNLFARDGATDEIYGQYSSRSAEGMGRGDSGGASRFFPVFRYEAKAPTSERPRDGETAHPTVKPLDLMRWLVRLVTPPGGTVLEPFAGSGTTAEACVIEGFRCIAIEREADYLPLIVNRLSKPIQIGLDFEGGAA